MQIQEQQQQLRLLPLQRLDWTRNWEFNSYETHEMSIKWNVYLIRANLHFKMATIGIWTN